MGYSLDHDLYSNNTSYYYWPSFLNNASNYTIAYDSVVNDVVGILSQDYQKWVFSITGCLLVGLSGIFPLLIFPNGDCSALSADAPDSSEIGGVNKKQLRRLLNFAVGSLLGDVFLHLLPEAWNHARENGSSKHDSLIFLGFWVLIGLVSFVICEKLVSGEVGDTTEESEPSPSTAKSTDSSNNNNVKISQKGTSQQSTKNKHIAGYLNLIANGFDNFTHGLAVAGSFIISPKIGLLTTAAILLHEIPHEIADFAILLRSGFNPWSAAKAQLSTASIGLLGAIFTLSVDCMKTMGDFTWWILPFTSGCFLNISLTHLLPDLMKEENPKESAKHLASLLFGIAVMAAVSSLHDG